MERKRVRKIKSKVSEYIERVKREDEVSRQNRDLPNKMLSLEDLYQVEKQSEVEELNQDLRKTLRIVKEKDEVINGLREDCVRLRIQFADAQNTIDQMRFRGVRSQSLSQVNIPVKVHASTQTKGQLVTSQTCSNWMEKVQNWRTESTLNLSQDSLGDSGFRGSVTSGRTPRLKHRPPTNEDNPELKNEVNDLDPLLDEVTLIAKRVQRKSLKLSRILCKYK